MASVLSSSPRKTRSTWRTPASPPSARPHMTARASSTARAPSARLYGPARVVGGADALDKERQVGPLGQPGDVRPAQVRVGEGLDPCRDRRLEPVAGPAAGGKR